VFGCRLQKGRCAFPKPGRWMDELWMLMPMRDGGGRNDLIQWDGALSYSANPTNRRCSCRVAGRTRDWAAETRCA
jgi:hypothetical protein